MNTSANLSKQLRRIPRWGRILLIVVGVIILAGLIIPYFIDADRYRTDIAGALENQTQRKVTIGKIHARLLPSIGFVVDDFHMSNPTGFPAGDFVSVESVKGSLAWGPLLHGHYQVSSVELVHPKLTLLDADNGATNYSFPSKPGGSKSAAGGESGKSSMALEGIDTVTLSGAEVTVGRAGAREITPSLIVQGVDVTLRQLSFNPVDVKQWNGEASLSGVRVALEGWKVPLKFSSGTVKLGGGRLDADFAASIGKAADLKGKLSVADLDKGLANFELSTKQLDLDEFLSAQTATSAPSKVAKPSRSELLAQGRISAERIRWQPYNANDAAVEVRVYTDRLEVWPLSLRLYGGTLQVSARSDRTQEPQRFSANVQLSNIDVNGVLSATAPNMRGKITGTAELKLQLVGSMGSQWQRAMAGTGDFSVKDGHVPGLDTSASGGFASLAGKLAGKAGLNEIPYREIKGDLSIASARVASRDIHVDSPDAVIDLQGSFGLDSTLNYEGNVQLASGGGGGGANPAAIVTGVLGQVLKQNVTALAVPVSIRGTFQDPKVFPGHGVPTITSGAKTPSSTTAPQKKSILDLFKKP